MTFSKTDRIPRICPTNMVLNVQVSCTISLLLFVLYVWIADTLPYNAWLAGKGGIFQAVHFLFFVIHLQQRTMQHKGPEHTYNNKRTLINTHTHTHTINYKKRHLRDSRRTRGSSSTLVTGIRLCGCFTSFRCTRRWSCLAHIRRILRRIICAEENNDTNYSLTARSHDT